MADDDAPTKSVDKKERARLAGAVVAVGLLVALGFDNRHEVRIGYLFGHSNVRLVYLLIVTAVLGALAGRLSRRRRRS